jgi:hypothetical protein
MQTLAYICGAGLIESLVEEYARVVKDKALVEDL